MLVLAAAQPSCTNGASGLPRWPRTEDVKEGPRDRESTEDVVSGAVLSNPPGRGAMTAESFSNRTRKWCQPVTDPNLR